MPEITEEFLRSAQSSKGGWSRAQFALLGVPWPPAKGWKARVIGTRIDVGMAQRFIDLKDKHLDQLEAPQLF